MTDEEIIKALECCSHRNGNLQCEHCPAYSIAQMCMEDLMSDAFNLINRQKAEIERLEQDNKVYHEANLLIAYQRNQRDKEIEELLRQLNDLHFMEQQIKSEAIKDFAERLKEEMQCEDDCGYHCFDCCYECKDYVPVVDELVKKWVIENESMASKFRI